MEMNYGTNELHQLEKELNTDIVPGTEIMTDVGSYHFVKASSGVLVPQPSDDRHDPLNWSWTWKSLAIATATFVSLIQGMGPLSLAPMFEFYVEDFHTDLAGAVQFTGVAILILGFSNFIWVPMSTSFGRRPVYLLSTLICMGSTIWRAKAQTYRSFMGASILNGIGAGPAEVIQPAVIADIFFLHDRGKWNTLFWAFYMGSLTVGPLIAGPMSIHVGWRNFWWLNTGLLALAFLLVVFFFPETRWHRAHPSEILAAHHDSPLSPTSVSDPEKLSSSEAVGEKEGLGNTTNVTSDLTREETAERDPWLGRGGPSRKQFMPFTPCANPLKTILLDLWIPWKLFAFPIVEFAAFGVSFTCSSFLTTNLTQTQAFAAPPYNLSAQTIGLFNLATLIGMLIGLFTAGPLSDWVSARATRKNGGIREPEMRLPAMIPYMVISYLGNIIESVGIQNGWPWQAVIVIGYGCAGIQTSALPAIISTYAVDSYKPVAGSIFVAITVNKNVYGYGFSKFITPWIIKDGFIPPIMTNATLIQVFCLFGILFYFKGKTFRRWTKNSNVHTM